MSKRLKSFHKLFFIVIFSILFSGVIGSSNSPELPEKIAPELEQIEALPRRTKPAELNIEITKIKSEPLEEVYIDRENKNIYVDFSKKREQALKRVKSSENLEKKYSLVISEKAQSNGEVIGKGRTKIARNTQVMAYETAELDGKKMLKIPYENEPEKLYISVQENNQVIKVYSMDIENAPLINEKTVIEDKTVIINLTKGIETYNQKYLSFNLYGSLINTDQGISIPKDEVEIIKDSGFINSFSEETDITISYINTNGNVLSTISGKKNLNQPIDIQIFFNDPTHEGFAFMYNADGSLKLRLQQINSTGAKSYTFNITHTSGGQTKKHTLIINSQSQPQPTRQLMNRTSSLQNVIIEDIEGLSTNTEYNFGTLGIEQVGNGSDLLDKTNPFPVLALGKQEEPNGWRFQSTNTFQTREPVVTTFNLNNLGNINMQMYFSNTTTSVTNVGGGLVTLIKKGNSETLLGAFSDTKREKMDTFLKGKINSDGAALNSLLNNFRGLNEYEVELSSNSSTSEQITYVVGQRTGTMTYTIPSVSDLDSSLVTDRKIEYLSYPKLILKKTNILEELNLNLTSDFKLDNSIIFTSSGITSIPGASLKPTNTRNLKSLHFASKFKLKNNSNETAVIDVDTTGNSTSSNEFIINNGSNELKLSLQYKNRYPEIKILNAAKAGTYTLNIVHYEPSTLERLNYTLNIVLQNDLVLPEPGMVRTNNLSEFIIEDDIENETYKIINSDLGTLTMQQTKTIPAGDMFPFIALGAKDGSTGWSFNSSSPSKARGADIIVKYRNDSYLRYPLNLKMSLEKNVSLIGATEIGVTNNNLLTGTGLFKLNENEKISALLKGVLETTSSEVNLLSLLAEFRSRSEREIILTPIEELENQISYVIGDYKNNTYTVPTNITLSSVDKKVDSIKYPNIKIRKPLLEENVTLTIPSTYDIKNPILFNKNGVNNGETTSDKDRYLKSLYYDSSFNINGATLKSITNGSSTDDYNITLNNGDNQLVMKVKYEDNYPKFTFLNNPSPGKYTLNIKHYDPVRNQRLSKGLERLDYTVDIVVLDSTSSDKEFDVTSSLRDIVILPDGKIESPDNWIKMVQLVSDKGKFPVIGINRPSWEIQTDRPLNPIDKRPTAILDLGPTFGKIEVPVNIRETPYQNIEKFLVYDRGDMTDRNIAVGAYTPLTSTDGSGVNNKVQVDFQVFLNLLPQTEIQKILNYAQAKFTADPTKTKVEIPYSTTDMNGSTLPTGYHKIYSIRGLQKATSKIFDVNQNNILDYGILDFPKIVVLENESFNTNTATLNFINPVPKSTGDISGTFDILFGNVPPNNLQAYNQPSSLNVTGLTTSWYGFTTIPEYHKIKISSATESKEFTTTENGDMKGTQTIISGNNTYVFMKGKIAPLAVGVLKWDFQQKTDDTITLEHLNNSGRVVAKDIYKINFASFSPSVYLDRTNSTMLNTLNATDKSLSVVANARQDFIDLGILKLQNYQKDITKTEADPIGVQVQVDSSELLLRSTDGTNLKGKLEFDDGKTSLTNPNEIGNLKFIITSPAADYDNIVGKTFTIERTSTNPLISIKGGGVVDSILNKLTVKLQDNQSGILPEMSFVSTLNSKTISENDIINGTTSFVMPGSVTLKQLTGGQGNSVPVIAIGDIVDWKLEAGNRLSPRRNRNVIKAKYQIGSKTIELEPELSNPIFSIDGGKNIYGQPVTAQPYVETTTTGKMLTALTYVINRDTRNERVSAGVKLNINSSDLGIILEELKNVSGDRVELKPLSNDKELSTNKAKIAYIHGRDVGLSGDGSEGNKLYIPTNTSLSYKQAYETLPSIFIEKEKLYKNVEINVLPGYVLGSKITFNSVSNITIPTGIQVIPEDNRVFEGLGYEHTVKLTLPGGEIKTYTTDSTGKLLITENVEKNGKTITLNIQYRSGKDVDVWISERNGSQYFDFVLQHIDPSGDVRRTTNIRINSGVEGSTAKLGEMDFVISSRYNATETPGQLISNPLAITSTGITYQTEVLDLKLLNGDFPEAPGVEKSIEVKDSNGSNSISIASSGGQGTITLSNGTILKITKTGSDLTIKPLKWNYNATDKFVLTYKNGTVITNQYTFNVVCPEFFVASVGMLDFGKLYKIGNPSDKTVTTNIELEYRDGSISPTYSLDVSQSNPNGTLANALYLNDEKTLLVKDLHLGNESGAGNVKRMLPLTGTVHGNSVKNTNPGIYQKTIQILIHLK